MTRILYGAAPLCFPLFVHAGRPLVTDNAGLTEARSCQLETWYQHSDSLRERWVLPACNPWGNLEVTLGAVRFSDERLAATDYLLQGKTLFRALEKDSYGGGVAFGAIDDRHAGNTLYGYIPVSVSLFDDNALAHFNLGWRRDGVTDEHPLTWGAAIQTDLFVDRLNGFIEVFGDNRSDPNTQLGVSFAIIPDRLHFDLTFGRALSRASDSEFVSVGIDIYLPALW